MTLKNNPGCSCCGCTSECSTLLYIRVTVSGVISNGGCSCEGYNQQYQSCGIDCEFSKNISIYCPNYASNLYISISSNTVSVILSHNSEGVKGKWTKSIPSLICCSDLTGQVFDSDDITINVGGEECDLTNASITIDEVYCGPDCTPYTSHEDYNGSLGCWELCDPEPVTDVHIDISGFTGPSCSASPYPGKNGCNLIEDESDLVFSYIGYNAVYLSQNALIIGTSCYVWSTTVNLLICDQTSSPGFSFLHTATLQGPNPNIDTCTNCPTSPYSWYLSFKHSTLGGVLYEFETNTLFCPIPSGSTFIKTFDSSVIGCTWPSTAVII